MLHIVAILFFSALLVGACWAIGAMFHAERDRILAALRIEAAPMPPTLPTPRLSRPHPLRAELAAARRLPELAKAA